MLRIICKSKIHRATITETNLHYPGSITIDEELLEAADIIPNERVQIVNLNNGVRVETYVMPGKRGSGEICLNGAAARWGEVGDLVIIISYCLMTDEEARNYTPIVINVDSENKRKTED
ncbi:MAG: aspartate 1-decarboxylase [bacterium]